jgi:hypothetical protein
MELNSGTASTSQRVQVEKTLPRLGDVVGLVWAKNNFFGRVVSQIFRGFRFINTEFDRKFSEFVLVTQNVFVTSIRCI